MALIYKDRVKASTAAATSGTGTITLGSAATGFQAFSVVGDGNTCQYVIEGATAGEWEVGIGTYTASGTTLARTTVTASSNAGSLVNFTSGTHTVFLTPDAATLTRWDAAALASQSSATVTTGNVTGLVNTLHLLDISGMTAARDFVLPTVAATGDRVGVFCTTNAPTTAAYVLQIKSGAAGDLINGTDHSSTIWSSLLIKGECLIFRCINGSTVDWIVEYDGRIPQLGAMSLTGSDITTSATGWVGLDLTNADIARGCIVTVSGAGVSTIAWRRASQVLITGSWSPQGGAGGTVSDNEQIGWGCTYGGAPGVGTILFIHNPNHAGTAGRSVPGSGIGVVEVPAGSSIQHNQYAVTTSNLGARALNYATYLRVLEILK